MDIVSTYGDHNLARTVLENPQWVELKKLAHEFCTAFNVKVTGLDNSPRKLGVVDNNGIPLGELYTTTNCSDVIYIYESQEIVKKERSSKNTASNARDSKKIGNLIKALKKHNEEPVASKLIPHWSRAIRFGFKELSSDNLNQNITVPRDKMQFICEKLLGETMTGVVDENMLRDLLRMFRNEEKSKESKETNLNRFAKGVTAIKIPLHVDKYYIVCKANFSTSNNEVISITDVIRYESISDSPYAGLALMCRSRKPDNRSTHDNEFGISRCDQYWEDLDIVTCYNGDCMFLLVPDYAE